MKGEVVVLVISIGEKLFALEQCTVDSASIQMPALPLAFCSIAGNATQQRPQAGVGTHRPSLDPTLDTQGRVGCAQAN